MSARALAWAWSLDLPANLKFPLVAVSDAASPRGVAVLPQEEMGTMLGLGLTAVRANLRKLEERGLIVRVARYVDGSRAPDYILVAVDGAIPSLSDGTGSRRHPSSSTSTEEKKKRGGAGGDPEFAAEGVSGEMRADALDLLRRKRKVNGQIVTLEEMQKAAAALAAFNRAQGSDHGLGAHLPKLVGRIRERPNWTADKLVRLVESAWRLKWWENSGNGRRPTPAVVFGNANVFEQVVLDAAAEAAGKAITDTPERRGRYERTLEPE